MNQNVPSPGRKPVNARANGDQPPTDIPSNVKRAKNFKCVICRKWFTSQGHLKRHYNTTLHKNMEKQEENRKSSENANPTALVPSVTPQQPLIGSQDLQQRSTVVSPISLSSQGISSTPPIVSSDPTLPQPQDATPLLPPVTVNEGVASLSHYQGSSYSSQESSLYQNQVTSAPTSYSSVPSYQSQYSQSHQYSQIQHQQPQFMSNSLHHQQLGSANNVSSVYQGNFNSNIN